MLPTDDRRPVQLHGAGGGAETRCVLREPVNPSGPYQGLFRDSPQVDARAAEWPAVDERDTGRHGHGRFQRVDARCSASNDDQVIALQGVPSSMAFLLIVTRRTRTCDEGPIAAGVALGVRFEAVMKVSSP